MTDTLPTPKVFISYSWTPEKDKDFVKKVADRLVNECGINVLLDRYDLQVGDNKYFYMERMANDPTVDKVLIFSNKNYSEKANNRTDGVGNESTIISNEIYNKVTQSKFVPILLERSDSGDPYFPTFMKSLIYIDFSVNHKIEEEFDRLVRFIYNKPLDQKPELGQAPTYILENEPTRNILHFKVDRIKQSVSNAQPNSLILIEEYLEYFLDNLSKIKVEDDTSNLPYDQKIFNVINSTKPLRNEYLEVFESLIKLQHDSYIDILHRHIETWSNLTALEDNYYNLDNKRRCSQHYKFLFKELFMYMITIALKKDKFDLVGYLVNRPYFVVNSTTRRENRNFTFLDSNIQSLDEDRKKRLNNNRKSIATDVLIERMDYKNIVLEDIQETDRMLHYIALLSEPKSFWFPLTTMYDIHDISYMKKAESKIYFNKIKILFDVDSTPDLKAKIESIKKSKREYYDREYHLDDIMSGLNVDNLAILK